MEYSIRKVEVGDENALSYIQEKSWRAAFSSILSKETIGKFMDIDITTKMYKQLIELNIGYGYILFY